MQEICSLSLVVMVLSPFVIYFNTRRHSGDRVKGGAGVRPDFLALQERQEIQGAELPFHKAVGPLSFRFQDARFRPSARVSFLRRKAVRPPKKAPARVNTQMQMVTAYSLVVIMRSPHGEPVSASSDHAPGCYGRR
jgi:hypothetical protein